jgi:hypothetical protein
MTDDVDVRELTTLSVASNGGAFRMGVRDANGRDVGLVFPTDSIRSLMMSLFRVGDVAFKRIMNDNSARLVYPTGACRLQSSPGTDQLILIMTTTDGFDAAFTIAATDLKQLARQASEHAAAAAEQRSVLN